MQNSNNPVALAALEELQRQELPEKPYAYEGLTVQGVSLYRLTARPNENIEVPDEVGYTIIRRNLARRLTESRIAIATVGLGVQPAGRTVRAHVRATIITAGLARVAANIRAREDSTAKTNLIQKRAHPSNSYGDCDCNGEDCAYCNPEVEL